MWREQTRSNESDGVIGLTCRTTAKSDDDLDAPFGTHPHDCRTTPFNLLHHASSKLSIRANTRPVAPTEAALDNET
jgi:hypothetical protein